MAHGAILGQTEFTGTFYTPINIYQATITNPPDVATPLVRNIYAGTADLEAGVSALESGTIYFVYE